MDIFLTKNPLFLFRRHLLTYWNLLDYFYDGSLHFLELQKLHI